MESWVPSVPAIHSNPGIGVPPVACEGRGVRIVATDSGNIVGPTSASHDSPSCSTTSSEAWNTSIPLRATPTFPAFAMPLMGHIPQIPRLTGEGRATGDLFAKWHEHFENVARLLGWDDHWKLVHLTSNLRDTAMAFYHSCSPDVRYKYPALVGEIKPHFTPI